ncbi:MAG: glycine reductase, partial [Chloroflexi bacterium]|nr:glycine reductase [Chloroflexota bacterium]
MNGLTQPVIQGVRYSLAHTPGLVRHGFKPSMDISKTPALLGEISSHLRSYQDAVSYPPNQVFLGSLYPDELRGIKRPWFDHNGEERRRQPHGELIPEEELYGLLKISDAFDFVWLEQDFTKKLRTTLEIHPLIEQADLERLGEGRPYSAIEAQVAASSKALPLYLKDGSVIGCINRASAENATLAADVLLENLACKATATLALRTLLHDEQIDPNSVDYIINCGEEAVGDPYQRGGGNLAKAIGEMCGLDNATGSD